MNVIEWAFGKRMTPAERLRKHQRALEKTQRELDRERVKLENQEKKLVQDIKKSAKNGQIGACKIQAKDLVRTRRYIGKFYSMRTQLQAISLRIQTVRSNEQMMQSMKGATSLLGSMNRQMNLPALQRIAMEFERENDVMDQRQEMMDDAIDDVTGLEDEEEGEEVVNQVLDEIGVDLNQALGETPSGLQKNAVAEGRVAQAVGGGGGGGEDDDLQARLDSLRRHGESWSSQAQNPAARLLSPASDPRSLSNPHLFKLAGTTGRRVSQGGFLNRVFGSSAHARKEKDNDSVNHTPRTSTERSSLDNTAGSTIANTDSSTTSPVPKVNTTPGNKSEELNVPGSENKKRRSSSAKAAAFLNSAKNTLLGNDREGPLTPMQKLGKTDAALIVPQGSLNNSAGESHQTPNSSFTVGVTEDKNKKCRRTMEDTHSYLYNFLGTPAPVLPSDVSLTSKPTGAVNDTMADGAPSSSQQPVETDNGYFAIFDGHAGTFAAEWCGKKLHIILEDLMRKNPNTPVPELLDQTFTSADQQLENLPLKNSGCTAITAVLRWEDRVPNSQSATGSTAIAPAAVSAVKQSDSENADAPTRAAPSRPSTEKASQVVHKIQETASRQRVLYTANVGDARIVLCRNGKALRLSYDHKGSDENEGRRISNAGGLILNNRVNGVLAVTRALGDSYLKDLVTGHPYTTETVIQPDIDEFLILACDGLWDVCSDQEAVDLIRNNPSPQAASKALVDHALSRFSTDNLSVMIVRFDSKKLQTNTSSNIGVEREDSKAKGPSEVETIINEARRTSGIEEEAVAQDESESEELKTKVMKQIEEEDHEPGPGLTSEGVPDAEKVYVERSKGSTVNK